MIGLTLIDKDGIEWEVIDDFPDKRIVLATNGEHEYLIAYYSIKNYYTSYRKYNEKDLVPCL